jgi:hypothetical protein
VSAVQAASQDGSGVGHVWLPVLILLGVLLLAYLGMWRGWRRRAGKHDLAPLVPVPAEADLSVAQVSARVRYFGTTVSGDWLDRVVARGLGARSTCTLTLTSDGLDVLRAPASFRIPASALRGARQDRGIAGKVIPPHGLLVVTWQHGDYLLDTGFQVTEQRAPGSRDLHAAWVARIDDIVKEHASDR